MYFQRLGERKSAVSSCARFVVRIGVATGTAREIRPVKLRDGRPMYHLATARCKVDITTGKASFLRVFTSFLAHFPHEKMHTDIDQFSPIDVF